MAGDAETARAGRAELSRNALLKRIARVQLTTDGRDDVIRALMDMDCLPPRKTPRRGEKDETSAERSA